MKQVYLESKKAHKEAIISTVCYQDANNRKLPNLMFSASEDGTIKLWDLRLNKAAKLLKDSNLKTENYSNLQLDSQNNNLYIACDEKLLAFDIKTDGQTSYFNAIRDRIWNFFIERKLILRPLGNTIYILAPYCITEDQMNKVYTGIIEFLDQTY